MPRAEHKAIFAGALGYMYMFGGVTQLGLMNDFYTFDPTTLMWEEGKIKRGKKRRITIHSLAVDKFNFIYLFIIFTMIMLI